MWVSRQEWDRLHERLKRLEDAHSPYDDPHSITVYEVTPYMPFGYPLRHEKITLKDLVGRIASHIGMGLKYRGGHPAGVDMVPLASSSAASRSPEEKP